MNSIVSINTCLSLIANVSYTYTITMSIQSSFTLYKRQGLVVHFLNPAFGGIVLMYSLNQQPAACKKT